MGRLRVPNARLINLITMKNENEYKLIRPIVYSLRIVHNNLKRFQNI